MKKVTLTCLILMFVGSLFAQSNQGASYYEPLWTVGVYSTNATITFHLYIDDELQTGINWEVGAYDMNMDEGDWTNVVGFAQPLEDPRISEEPFYVMTYSSDPGHLITFKLFDHNTNQELDHVTPLKVEFETNGELGNLDEFYEFRFYTHRVMEFNPTTDNTWEELTNWTENEATATSLPDKGTDAFINGKCIFNANYDVYGVTVNPTGILTDTKTTTPYNTLTASNGITVKDGGQIVLPKKANYNMTATFEKTIQGYGTGSGKYALISYPYSLTIDQAQNMYANAGMLEGEYDLFYFDQRYPNPIEDDNMNGEWRNFKYYQQNQLFIEGSADDEGSPYDDPYWHTSSNNNLSFGYLYANMNTTTLKFTNKLFTAANDFGKTITLLYFDQDAADNVGADYPADERCLGFNLLGNPWSCNASVAASTGEDNLAGFYIMNQNGTNLITQDEPVVAPCTGIFAVAAASGVKVRFTRAADNDANVRSMGTPRINVEILSNDGVLEDRAYVRMEESANLVKFSLNNNGTQIFVPQNSKKYAATYKGEANVMPLCFTSTEGGIHTICVKLENTDCSYLHLIDNVTGADIDLLRTPKYTFNANDSHYATRFKLVFDEQATDEIAESFAFISNGELMINNSGNATLQVMDITGRILSTENIQNCYSKNLNLSAGVYVVRLNNGTDVKAQKIVVE